MDAAIVMVMMAFLVPVQRRVRRICQHVHRRANTRHRDRLPQQGQQQHDDDGYATHEAESLANAA